MKLRGPAWAVQAQRFSSKAILPIFIRDFSFGYIKKFLLDQFRKVFGSLRTINVNRNKKYKNFIG